MLLTFALSPAVRTKTALKETYMYIYMYCIYISLQKKPTFSVQKVDKRNLDNGSSKKN